MKRLFAISISLILLAGMLVVPTAFAAGASVSPVIVPDNPFLKDYQDLGYDFDYLFKIDNGGGTNVNGTWPIELDGVYVGDVTITGDGTHLNWSSTVPINAVSVKGGNQGANLYIYDPAVTGDTDLHAPQNKKENGTLGAVAGISHVDFLFRLQLEASKTAVTTFTRTWDWSIAKTVTPDAWDLFVGDSGTSDYTVTLDKLGYVDSDWAVSGTITVTNPYEFSIAIDAVTDQITGLADPLAIDWGGAAPESIGPGETITGTYSSALPDNSTRVNTVSVDTGASALIVRDVTATADVIFGEPTTRINDTVHVTDNVQGDLGAFSDDGAVSYSRTFTEAGTYPNTATIVETGQSASAVVQVNTYELTFGDRAAADFTRSYSWTIDKSADQSELLLTAGQEYIVNYTVSVAAAYTDSPFNVSGVLTINNPAPMNAVLTGISITGAGLGSAVELVAAEVPVGGSVGVPFLFQTADASPLLISIVRQNYDYDASGNANAGGTTEMAASSSLDFGNAVRYDIDETIDVTDTNVGSLGTVTYNDQPASFNYPLTVGPYALPGTYYVDNTAGFVTNDTGTTGENTWQVVVTIPDEQTGATLTQGYWKTHSEYGPAPYDDAWENLSIGADTPFFGSGRSCYEVLWTAPKGDAYYNLAHQYIAAELNILNGADPTDAQAAFDAATAFFAGNDPGAKLSKSLKNAVLGWAAVLDDYNNGVIGPGHADE